MFRQHKIICENKEVIIYLFLYDQDIDLVTMKNIFSQISNISLEERLLDYFKQNHIRFTGQHIRIVYHSTIIKDFYLNHCQFLTRNCLATNVINFYR